MQRFNADFLRTVRLDLGLSQDEAASALGVDVRTYRRYESGAVNAGRPFEVRNASRRRLLARMCAEFGVAGEAAWLTSDPAGQAAPTGSAPLRRSHALQPAAHFIGREQALDDLAAWRTMSTRGSVFAVVGVGGAGKTALIARFVASLGEHRAWTHSFYDDPGTEAVVAMLTSEPQDDARGTAPLIVLDGLETVQSEGGNGRAFGEIEDPALRRVLRSVAAGLVPWRVLVTSRFALTDLAAWEGSGVRSLKLPPLSRSESIEIFRAWGLSGGDDALAALCERTGGHALSVSMLGSYIGAFLRGDARNLDSVALSRAADDDPIARRLAAVLDAYARSLMPTERELLARLSLFAGAAELPLLIAIARSDEHTVLRTIARLERLGLVARTHAGITAHPFVREYFKTQLEVPGVTAHAALRDALRASLEGKPALRVRDPGLLDRYEMLLEHTRRAGQVREAWGIYQRALGGFANLGLRLGAMTRGARALASFAHGGAPERLDAACEGELRASLLYDWALYAGALGDLALAGRCHVVHLAAAESMHHEVGQLRRMMGLRTHAYVQWLSGDTDAARRTVAGSLGLAREAQSEFHIVRALALAAIIEHDGGDRIASERYLAEALELEPEPTARRAFWQAEILIARGANEAARKVTERAIAECESRGWAGHVAHGTTLLGLSWVDEDASRAAVHLAGARSWVQQSGEVEMALRWQHLAVRVARGEGRVTDAAREIALGRALAETHGFKGFVRLFERLE